uniref:Uncharacterized protein n=1 Tax=Panagrolaimus sp. ES5 TaxID=591445 RepID=A0AC34GEX1_9BILA
MESDASAQSTSTVFTTKSETLQMESQMPTTEELLETSTSRVTKPADSNFPSGITTATPDQTDALTSETVEIQATSVKHDTTLEEISSSISIIKSTTAKPLTTEFSTSDSKGASTDDQSKHLTSPIATTTQTNILSSSNPEETSDMPDKTTTSRKMESKTTVDEFTKTDGTSTVSKEVTTTVGKIAETTMTDGKNTDLTTEDESSTTVLQKTNDFSPTTSSPGDFAKTTSEFHTNAVGELSITTESALPSTSEIPTDTPINAKSLLFCGFQACASENGYDAKISFGFHDRIGINCSN